MSFDAANRELCPDDTCIGVIGADGLCNECGKVGQSVHTHSRLRGMQLDDGDGALEPDDDRELCPDGACIGLIGPDGRCKECGRAGERAPAGARPASAPASEPASEPAAEPAAEPDASGAPGSDIDDRELCPDGMCIGVIGPDGRCKVCGSLAE